MADMVANEASQNSMRNLVGWLSLCMVSAGWGPQADSTTKRTLAIAGALGLASAVGLEAVSRVRSSRSSRRKLKEAERRIDAQIRGTEEELAFLKQVDAAKNDGEPARPTRSASAYERRRETRYQFHCPVLVNPLERDETTTTASANTAIKARVRDISAHGVGMEHDQPIPTGPALLTFLLADDDTVSIVAEVTWQFRESDDRYSSGGKLVEVVGTEDDCGVLALPMR